MASRNARMDSFGAAGFAPHFLKYCTFWAVSGELYLLKKDYTIETHLGHHVRKKSAPIQAAKTETA